jgi:hypothetical protein
MSKTLLANLDPISLPLYLSILNGFPYESALYLPENSHKLPAANIEGSVV